MREFHAAKAHLLGGERRKLVLQNAQLAGKIVADEIGEAATFVHCDVTREADWKAAVQEAIDQFGHLDIVVNNAGYSHYNQPMLEVDEAEFDRVYAVNVKSLYLSAQVVVPVFRAQEGGCFLNIASTAGVRPRPGLSWYNSSKFAAIGITKSMAVELAPEKIRVCALNPVAGETALLERPVRGADPRIGAYLVRHADAVLEPRTPAKPGSLDVQVREEIDAGLLVGSFDQPAVARSLGMSVRSLQRGLKDLGTSFSSELEQVRRERAESLLQRAELSVADVAFMLGYADPRPFYRSFRRWTGQTPQQFRRALTESVTGFGA